MTTVSLQPCCHPSYQSKKAEHRAGILRWMSLDRPNFDKLWSSRLLQADFIEPNHDFAHCVEGGKLRLGTFVVVGCCMLLWQ